METINTAVAALLMAFILITMALSSYRSVCGPRAGLYRIAVICLIVGLNFNTTDTVTGDVMAEFGLFMLFFGILFAFVLVFIDAYKMYGIFLAKRRSSTSHQIKEVSDSGLTD